MGHEPRPCSQGQGQETKINASTGTRIKTNYKGKGPVSGTLFIARHTGPEPLGTQMLCRGKTRTRNKSRARGKGPVPGTRYMASDKGPGPSGEQMRCVLWCLVVSLPWLWPRHERLLYE